MTTNNSINTGGLATTAEAQAGTDNRVLIAPSTLKTMTDERVVTGVIKNLGMTLSGGTLTMCAADGSALSVSNVAQVQLVAANSTIVTHNITANVTLADSSLTGNLFNTRNLVAWGEQHPFYVYVGVKENSTADTAPVFFLSSQPHHVVLPVAAAIGQPSSAIADAEYSFFCFSAITATQYAGGSCICVGSLRATKDASNVWTFTALDQTDGINQYKENTWFPMPVGQFIASSYFINVTPPAFSSQSMYYSLDRNGICYVKWDMSGDGGTDGSGTNQIQIFLPFNVDDSQGGSINRRGQSAQTFFAGTTRSNLLCDFPSGTQRVAFYRVDSTALVLCNLYTNGDRYLNGSIKYFMRSS